MKYPKIEIPESTTDKLIKVGLLVAAFFVGKKMLAKGAQNSADNQIDTDPAAGQARSLNAAMMKLGLDWSRDFDGTDADAIYQIAPLITDLDKVKDYYTSQTKGRVLHDDLTKELGAEGYNKFLALATKGKSGTPKYATVRNDIPANRYVVTKLDSNIRKTAKKESKYMPNNNILKIIPKGQIIGVSTGKFAYDEPNDVVFVEFFTFESKTMKRIYFYVANSQVELITKEQKEKRDKSGKIPIAVLQGLAGFTNTEGQTQAISIRATTVYDETFQSISTAPKNIIIGFPIMELNTKKGRFTKVRTVQGKIRWVNSEDITIQNR